MPIRLIRTISIVLGIALTLQIIVTEAQSSVTKLSQLDAFNTKICGMTSVRSEFSRWRDGYRQSDGQLSHRTHDSRETNRRNSSISHRISNGWLAIPGEFPWYVSLVIVSGNSLSPKYHICGANLIHNNLILTAAHCFTQHTGDATITAYMGAYSRRDRQYEQGVRVKKACLMEGFRPDSFPRWFGDNEDIAMAELEHPVVYNQYVQPICMQDLQSDREAQIRDGQCVVAGMGLWISQPDVIAYHLSALPSRKCSFWDAPYHNLFERDDYCFMSSDPKFVGNACPGDSGGAMMCPDPDSKRVYLVGTASWARTICKAGQQTPVYFASVFKLRNKIIKAYRTCFATEG